MSLFRKIMLISYRAARSELPNRVMFAGRVQIATRHESGKWTNHRLFPRRDSSRDAIPMPSLWTPLEFGLITTKVDELVG